jgi:uncharacterized protein
MEFDWDPAKAASNLAKHGVSFELVHELDWDSASIRVDARKAYGEVRLLALVVDGDGDHYIVVFTPRHGRHRVISARRAGRVEIRKWSGTKA